VAIPVREAVMTHARAFQAGPEEFRAPGSGLLGEEHWFRRQAREWRAVVESELAEFAQLRERGTPVCQLRYEELHADVARASRTLYAFLGVSESDADPIGRASLTTPGFEGSGHLDFYRKGAVGEWKEYFTDTQKRWFKEEAGEVLVRAGYEEGFDW
jgi:hypothetical protein